ncbi:hypothetical protein C8233_17835 [Halomonas sp. SF2003]|nr:hypothetical protein C8233_17835 [Halomonas sp. SF2003]
MFNKYVSLGYRNDVQGLRALCSLMIMSFHIWMHKVSGGVDVFFVISGFLMASVLLKSYFISNIYNPMFFWASIARRVFPSAYVVIITTLILSCYILSPSYLSATVDEIIATIFHLENIQLIRKSVDYLASDVPSSPVQQFWALSIQMQFYFILPILLIPLVIVSKKLNSSWPMILVLLFIMMCSFVYSVISSNVTPQASYFNPLARLWEFLFGVAMYLLSVNIKNLNNRGYICLAGIIMIFGGALLIPTSFQFPGFIALVPVIGAGLVVLSGVGGQSIVNRLLGNVFLKYLGGISFSIYLWHWPIIVFYKEYFNVGSIGLVNGLGIIVSSILLAIITNLIIEKNISKIPKSNVYLNILIGVLFFVSGAAATLLVKNNFISIENEINKKWHNASIENLDIRRIKDKFLSVDIPRDELIAARRVLPIPYSIGCHQKGSGITAKKCIFGDVGSNKKVVLVGGSHALQWLPALRLIAKKHNFEIISISKSSCPFGALESSDNSCKIWNRNVLAEIKEINPILVITNSTRTSTAREYVPKEYIGAWNDISSLGIKLIGIRDNPRFSYDVPDCVYKQQESSYYKSCVKQRMNYLSTSSPVENYRNIIGEIDLTDWLCNDKICPVVNGNILMYRDSHHIHLPYVIHLTTVIERKMNILVPKLVGL